MAATRAHMHGLYGAAALDSTDRNILCVRYCEQVTPGSFETVALKFVGRRVR